MMDSIEGIVDKLEASPISAPLVYQIKNALYQGHEYLQVHADRISTVEIVALHELGFQMWNQLSVGEIRIKIK